MGISIAYSGKLATRSSVPELVADLAAKAAAAGRPSKTMKGAHRRSARDVLGLRGITHSILTANASLSTFASTVKAPSSTTRTTRCSATRKMADMSVRRWRVRGHHAQPSPAQRRRRRGAAEGRASASASPARQRRRGRVLRQRRRCNWTRDAVRRPQGPRRRVRHPAA